MLTNIFGHGKRNSEIIDIAHNTIDITNRLLDNINNNNIYNQMLFKVLINLKYILAPSEKFSYYCVKYIDD